MVDYEEFARTNSILVKNLRDLEVEVCKEDKQNLFRFLVGAPVVTSLSVGVGALIGKFFDSPGKGAGIGLLVYPLFSYLAIRGFELQHRKLCGKYSISPDVWEDFYIQKEEERELPLQVF